MRRFIAVLLAALMVISFAACTQKPAESSKPESAAEPQNLLDTIKARGSLIIATEGAWAPWTYHDENDKLVGLDIEIGQLLADGLGVKAEFAETNWEAILSGVSSGRFDIACNGVGYSEERAKSYNFSDPYVYDRTVLVVRSDNDTIKTFDDLKGKKTTNSPNSLYAQKALDYGATVEYVDTLNETLAMVIDGRVDATINAEVSVNDYLKEHPDAPIKVVYKDQGAPIAFPVRKDASTETLIAEINRILEEARSSGKLAEISMKYFGLDLTTP
ncbi:MAG: transporter substrate-binding domain-containing protein [Firmicutes bacterium]|nr:transporter substrate-binding domain-containing protein [Bacillota bacterium]